VGKWELYFAICFSAKQTAKNGKEVLRLTICGVLRRNKHALYIVNGHEVKKMKQYWRGPLERKKNRYAHIPPPTPTGTPSAPSMHACISGIKRVDTPALVYVQTYSPLSKYTYDTDTQTPSWIPYISPMDTQFGTFGYQCESIKLWKINLFYFVSRYSLSPVTRYPFSTLYCITIKHKLQSK